MGSPAVLCTNSGISIYKLASVERECEQLYMEASSARDKATKLAPKHTRIHPYIIEAGPPFNKENWKVIEKDSQEISTMNPKLVMEGKLMNLYQYLLANTVRTA